MRRTVINLLVIVSATAGIFAQGSFGIKGGISVANQSISGEFNPDIVRPMVGFHGGVFLTWMFSGKIGVQPELLYSLQGSKTSWTSWADEAYEDRLGYITLPVLLRFNINELFSLHAGPQFGYLLSATEKFKGETNDIRGGFKDSDLGVAFGAELDLPARLGFGSARGGVSSLRKVNLPTRLGLGVRYVLGLYDVVVVDGVWEGFEVKNNTIQVYLKYRIAGS